MSSDTFNLVDGGWGFLQIWWSKMTRILGFMSSNTLVRNSFHVVTSKCLCKFSCLWLDRQSNGPQHLISLLNFVREDREEIKEKGKRKMSSILFSEGCRGVESNWQIQAVLCCFHRAGSAPSPGRQTPCVGLFSSGSSLRTAPYLNLNALFHSSLNTDSRLSSPLASLLSASTLLTLLSAPSLVHLVLAFWSFLGHSIITSVHLLPQLAQLSHFMDGCYNFPTCSLLLINRTICSSTPAPRRLDAVDSRGAHDHAGVVSNLSQIFSTALWSSNMVPVGTFICSLQQHLNNSIHSSNVFCKDGLVFYYHRGS